MVLVILNLLIIILMLSYMSKTFNEEIINSQYNVIIGKKEVNKE